jgi:hypothetical protein
VDLWVLGSVRVVSELAILVPVLGRPHRVKPFLDAVEGSIPAARVLFLADPHDRPEHEAIERELGREGLRVELDLAGGNYAGKINRGVAVATEPLLFAAADDLEPQPGWFGAAKAAMTGAVGVVGVNDLIERQRDHATHFLLSRAYAERPSIDGTPGPFFEGYFHWQCDDELIATAKQRGAYAYAPDAHVLHLHPMAGRAPDDATYQRGRARQRQDRKLFMQRSALWA